MSLYNYKQIFMDFRHSLYKEGSSVAQSSHIQNFKFYVTGVRMLIWTRNAKDIFRLEHLKPVKEEIYYSTLIRIE